MAKVIINEGESIGSAMRRFKRKVILEGIMRDVKKHVYFIPAGQKAKIKSEQARKRRKKRYRSPLQRS